MSEVVEIRLGSEVSEVVDQLARTMGDDTLCLPVASSVAEGEWVRFSIQLEDGTHVIEGVGRSAGAVPRGNPTSSYDLHLSDLSFDERNEIMYERMLIAKDAAKGGDDTGVIKLSDAEMAEIDDEEKDDVQRSVPPPPPATSLKDAAKKQVAPKKSTPPKKRASKPAPKKSTPPRKRASKSPAAATSKAKPVESDTTKVDLEAPNKARKDSRRPSRRPAPATVSDGPYSLEIDYELVAQARRLEDRLPRKLMNRDRIPGQPEAAILKTAIRVGLKALEALADDE